MTAPLSTSVAASRLLLQAQISAHNSHDQKPAAEPVAADKAAGEVDRELLDEGKLVNPDLTINRQVVGAIARYRAHREQHECAKIGWARPYSELFEAEVIRLIELALSLRETRRQQREVAALPLREQLIRSLELELARAENGLAQPYSIRKITEIRRDIAAAKREVRS